MKLPSMSSNHISAIAGMFAVFSLSLISVSGQESRPTPSPQPTKIAAIERTTGTISGDVSDDNGHPLSNAVVMIAPLTGNTISKSESTDETGKFSAKDLASGAYRIRVQSPAYLQSDDDLQGPDGFPKFYRTGEEVSFTLVKGGVITGTVTDRAGVPLVGVNVTALHLSQPGDPNPFIEAMFGVGRSTDDRGIYRIYGLRQGRYLVYVGAGRGFSMRPGPFDRDSPTYYPSSTRDTASMVSVQTGQEVSGIDIRYRGDRGYVISGTLTGALEKFTMITLMLPGNSTPVGVTISQDQAGRNTFAFSSVPNGDYKVLAFSSDEKMVRAASGTLNVSIKNSDVEGVVIKVTPLSSISGRFALGGKGEPKCETANIAGVEQIVISARPEKDRPEDLFVNHQNDSSADGNGEFSIRSLSGGNYRFRTSLPTPAWYIKSIERSATGSPQNPQPNKPTRTPAELVTLSSGENLSGLSIDLANGAGSVDGRIGFSGPVTDNLPLRKLYLVPSEKERADDTLRFSDTVILSDGIFSFRNLAPGHYFLIPRTIGDPDNFRPLYWDPKERAALITEGAATGVAVDVKPCQSIKDLNLKLGPNGWIK